MGGGGGRTYVINLTRRLHSIRINAENNDGIGSKTATEEEDDNDDDDHHNHHHRQLKVSIIINIIIIITIMNRCMNQRKD